MEKKLCNIKGKKESKLDIQYDLNFINTGLNVKSGYLWVWSMNDCYFSLHRSKISYYEATHACCVCSGKVFNLENSEKVS